MRQAIGFLCGRRTAPNPKVQPSSNTSLGFPCTMVYPKSNCHVTGLPEVPALATEPAAHRPSSNATPMYRLIVTSPSCCLVAPETPAGEGGTLAPTSGKGQDTRASRSAGSEIGAVQTPRRSEQGNGGA